VDAAVAYWDPQVLEELLTEFSEVVEEFPARHRRQVVVPSLLGGVARPLAVAWTSLWSLNIAAHKALGASQWLPTASGASRRLLLEPLEPQDGCCFVQDTHALHYSTDTRVFSACYRAWWQDNRSMWSGGPPQTMLRSPMKKQLRNSMINTC